MGKKQSKYGKGDISLTLFDYSIYLTNVIKHKKNVTKSDTYNDPKKTKKNRSVEV